MPPYAPTPQNAPPAWPGQQPAAPPPAAPPAPPYGQQPPAGAPEMYPPAQPRQPQQPVQPAQPPAAPAYGQNPYGQPQPAQPPAAPAPAVPDPAQPWASPDQPPAPGNPHYGGTAQPSRPSWGPSPSSLQQGVPGAPGAPGDPAQPQPFTPLSSPPYPGAPPAGMTAYGPYWLPGSPPKASVWPRRIGLILVVAVLATISLFVGRGIGSVPGTFNEALQPIPPKPSADAPEKEWEEYAAPAALALMRQQAKALIAGDEAGWLAVFDKNDKKLVDDEKTRFENLRALQVTNWDYRLDGRANASGSGDKRKFKIQFIAGYCFGASDPAACAPTDVEFPTEWKMSDVGLVATAVDESPKRDHGPRPFEVSELSTKVGQRVIVAAPPQYESRLSRALTIAEAAAENADKYAHWKKVDRYVVFLAGNSEFEEWYGTGDIGPNVVGFALPLGSVDQSGDWKQTGVEVVMHVDRLGSSDEFTSTMRHEFGHVVMLLGMNEESNQPEDWFLNEGIAEAIDQGDKPIDTYPRMRNVRDYLKSIDWKGELDPPTQSDDGLAGSGKYGLAFLAVRYMIDTYGLDAFYTFFEKVVRSSEPAESSSQAAYNESWSNVLAKIQDFIKTQVG